LSAELVRFAVVGVVGFLVDGGVLQLLVSAAGWSPFLARVVSFPAAFTATFVLNRLWTFQGLRMSAGRAYGAYGAIQLVGALINLAVFYACVLIEPRLYERPLIALAIGAGVAMLFNYYASRRVVFRP
jgi:putative flippase GtrA